MLTLHILPEGKTDQTVVSDSDPALFCSFRGEYQRAMMVALSKEERMNKKLYVGGLPYGVNDDQLHELFAAHGTVESARVITDKFTDRSRGFGFVEMSSAQEAEAAIAALDGSELQGRTLVVNIAKPREDRPRGGGGGGGQRNRW
jgi:RNA recognition motif-containing protein